jgi:hypothetical protein
MITWTLFAVKKKIGFYGGPCFVETPVASPSPLNSALHKVDGTFHKERKRGN